MTPFFKRLSEGYESPRTIVNLENFFYTSSVEKSPITTIYLMRHGATLNNIVEKDKGVLLSGHHNNPLTTEGENQAREVAQKLSSVRFTRVISSDLDRAFATAKIVAPYLTVEKDEDLRERNLGILEKSGMTSTTFWNEEVHRLHADRTANIINALPHWQLRKAKLIKGMETDEELLIRAGRVLRKVVEENTGETVLLVSSSNFIRTFLVDMKYGTRRELRSGTCENTAYVQLTTTDGKHFHVATTDGIKKKDNSEVDNFTELAEFSVRR